MKFIIVLLVAFIAVINAAPSPAPAPAPKPHYVGGVVPSVYSGYYDAPYSYSNYYSYPSVYSPYYSGYGYSSYPGYAYV